MPPAFTGVTVVSVEQTYFNRYFANLVLAVASRQPFSSERMEPFWPGTPRFP